MSSVKLHEPGTLQGLMFISASTLEEIASTACAKELQDADLDKSGAAGLANKVIEHILEQLKEQSSTYKYLVQVTLTEKGVSGPIVTSAGALWNTEKDGMWRYHWKGPNVDAIVLVTWIHKS